jgi:hypothetical protein
VQDADVDAVKVGWEHDVITIGGATKKFRGSSIKTVCPAATAFVVEKDTIAEAFITPGNGLSIVSEEVVVFPKLVGGINAVYGDPSMLT